MVGVTSINIKESREELQEKLRQTKNLKDKERLQVLYWLKQENPPTICEIALSLGKHRNTLQTWLAKYREGGIEGLWQRQKSPGGVRKIPKWAEVALQNRLKEEKQGFKSYGEVQQWLKEALGIEATYHAVYQMTHNRLKAKLKVPRPVNHKQNKEELESFKKTLPMTFNC